MLRVENKLLVRENAELETALRERETLAPDPRDFVREPDLDVVAGFLDRAGYRYSWGPDDRYLRVDFAGRNTRFGVTIQVFDAAGIVYLATRDYMNLDEAEGTNSVVLLMVQLATFNYDLLMGKFQLNPESGEILLSVELETTDGLGYATFVKALETLLSTADARYPDLVRAAEGVGM